MLSRLSIRTRFAAALGSMLLVVTVLCGVSLVLLDRMDRSADQIRENYLPGTRLLGEFTENLTRYRQLQGLYLMLETDAERARELRNLQVTREAALDAWRRYEPLVSTPEERRMADRIIAGKRDYLAQGNRLISLAENGNRAGTMALYRNEAREVFLQTRAAALELAERYGQGGAGAAARTNRIFDIAFWVVLGLGAAGVLAALGAWLWTERSTVQPLAAAALRMRALADGDKTSPVAGTDKADEIGRMAQALEGFRLAALDNDRMVEKVASDAAEKQARVDRVDVLVQRFEAEAAEALRIVASASTELAATAEEMKSTAQDGSERAGALAAAATQASANVQTAAASAEEMSASIAEVARQVTETARVARQTADDARATDGAVAALADSANRIGEVVRLIGDIASQTNLLALNATIEAARAGEAGKGFAVVASEVKALAGQTAKATEEIGAQISAMQAETTRAVDAIRGIARTIEGMDGLTAQVAAAAEEQAAAVQEIGRAVAEAAAGTTEVSRTAEGVTDGAQRTGAAAGQVSAASGELAQRSESLRGQVDRFLAGLRAA